MIAPNSTRSGFRAARGLVTGTVIGLAALGFSASAFGQTTGAGVPSTCDTIKNDRKAIHCEFDALKQRGVDADKRAAAADTKAAAAREQEACGRFLLQGVADQKWTKPEILAQAGGAFTPQNVCGVARSRGFDRRAALN